MSTLPIYLDSQATQRIDQLVSESITLEWGSSNGNPHSQNRHGERAKAALLDSIGLVADFIGCLPRELTITSGATLANNLAIQGIENISNGNRKKIIISAIEHPCVLETARFMAQRRGFELSIIPVSKEGFIKIDELTKIIDENTAIVSVILGNNEIGTIQDVRLISELAHKAGALMHTDATQAAGRIKIDVVDLKCDSLSFSAHKMGGPIGIGSLYVREGIELEPLIHGGGQQHFSSGTMSPELCVGFGKACELLESHDYGKGARYLNSLIETFESGLIDIGYKIKKNGPNALKDRLPGTTSLTFNNVDLRDMHNWISPYVSFSTRSACSTEKIEQSHVLSAIGLTAFEADNTARFSVNHTNNMADIKTSLKYFQEYFLNRLNEN